MGTLDRCTSCGAFVVRTSCPSCGSGAARATRLGAIATLMGSSVFAMTLMACYGCPDNQCGGTALPDASTEGGGGTADTRTPATPGIPDASADRNVADADASSDAGADADAADGG